MHFVNNKTSNVRITLRRVRKAISITYSENVSVALGIQHAMGMPHIVICGQFGSTIFLHIL